MREIINRPGECFAVTEYPNYPYLNEHRTLRVVSTENGSYKILDVVRDQFCFAKYYRKPIFDTVEQAADYIMNVILKGEKENG